jgi:DNA-binding NtrC family response regulator
LTGGRVPFRTLIIHDIAAETARLSSSDALALPEIAIVKRVLWRSASADEVLRHPTDLIVAEAESPSASALELFRWLRDTVVRTATIGILPAADGEFLQMAAGSVDDFLIAPVNGQEFRQRITRLLGPPSDSVEDFVDQFLRELAFQSIVGADRSFRQTLNRVAQFARSDAPVLLCGETGTGKELCARAIHMLSSRRDGPFIPVECGAIPENLFESEVFGHSRGAYTGAHADQKGLVEMANGGTFFLDEVDGLPLAAQGKLLRLLQESTFRPLGSSALARADVRVVAASNTPLARLVDEKKFRADLFFRLNVLSIELPPLRKRPGDIALLARRFVEELARSQPSFHKSLSPAAVRKLERYTWPGNVRELYNTMHRAVLTSPGAEILATHIEIPSAAETETAVDFRRGRARAIAAFESEYVNKLLQKNNGNVTRAAQEAGKERRAFGRLVKKYRVA